MKKAPAVVSGLFCIGLHSARSGNKVEQHFLVSTPNL
jgi:hypothetical protein